VLLVAGFDLAVAMVFPRDVALVRVCQKNTQRDRWSSLMPRLSV
jgi:hypothetical protein